jgi:hypothetical protein
MKNYSNTIICPTAGDVIGSVFECDNVKTTDLTPFDGRMDYTDDSLPTIAVADCNLNKIDFAGDKSAISNNFAFEVFHKIVFWKEN